MPSIAVCLDRYELRWRNTSDGDRVSRIVDVRLEYHVRGCSGFVSTVRPMRAFQAKREAVRRGAAKAVKFHGNGELIGEVAPEGDRMRWRFSRPRKGKRA